MNGKKEASIDETCPNKVRSARQLREGVLVLLNKRACWFSDNFHTVQIKLLTSENINAAAATMRAGGKGAIAEAELGLT